MRQIEVISDNIVSPLGFTTAENYSRLKKNETGIRMQPPGAYSNEPFYAALLSAEQQKELQRRWPESTRFESLLLSSIEDALHDTGISLADPKTILIISSTKGNIGLLETEPVDEKLEQRIALHESARRIAARFQAANEPVIVSHACISGLLATITGMRILRSGLYDHAVIAGADLISKFVLSGFQSFQAISAIPCKPFDAARNGITLGEGAATLVLSALSPTPNRIRALGGSVSNDANHISGPSRTGEELWQAIGRALKESAIKAEDIDLISAHGTATIYNDEMECKAFTLAELNDTPVNSLKGYYGHTLGAAGLIESIISIHSMQENILLPTRGFEQAGTSQPLMVSASTQQGDFAFCLKTASGFGGCNAAIIFNKPSA